MKYYKMIPDSGKDKRQLVCVLDRETLCIGWNSTTSVKVFDFTPNDFDLGKLIQNWPNGVTFLYEKKKKHITNDYFCSDFNFLIFSKKAIDGLGDCLGAGIQLLGVSLLETKSGERDESYNIVNVINVIDVIDWDHSNYSKISVDKEDGKGEVLYNMMIRPVFREKEMEHIRPNIFKTKDDEIPIYVSEEFKNYCEREKLTGFEFYEIEQK